MSKLRFFDALLLLCLLTACSSEPKRPDDADSELRPRISSETSKGSSGSARTETDGRKTAVVPGFMLQLTCPQDSKLSGKYRVDFDGVLRLPYKVNVPVLGLTLEELQQRLSTAYSSYFRNPPSFKAEVVEKMYAVRVNGLVEKPGTYLVRDTSTLDEVIALAGGLPKADGKTVTAQYVRIEQTGGHSVTVKLADYYGGGSRAMVPKWKGGDLIFLQSEAVADYVGTDVQLLGEVRNPGEYRFKGGADFYYYIGKAGGPTERADLGKIELVRGTSYRRVNDTYSADSVPVIQAGDQLIIHPDRPTKLERTASVIATLLSVVNTVFLAILVF